MKVDEIDAYMAANELDSVIIGKHSQHGYFTALRTSRTRTLAPNHGRGDTAAAALNNLMAQDAGLAKPVPEELDLSNAAPAARTTLSAATGSAAADDDFEDLLG